jgi:poly-gamma-glutamate capsule biosynthesis protein CapA/YwtB (metallophosphatase superfamily)
VKSVLFSFGGSILVCSSILLLDLFHSQPESNKVQTSAPVMEYITPDSSAAVLLFAGDVMGHDPQIAAARRSDGSYDYTSDYRFIQSYIKKADWAMANLEVTLAGTPYSGYPTFSSPDALAKALREAGFDVLQTANNHTCDKGLKGLKRTLDVLDSLGLDHLGSYRNPKEREENYPYFKTVNGIRICFLNYSYGTNGLPVPAGTVVNLIDTAVIRKDLEKAKKEHPDFIVSTFHWGLEYQRNESAEQMRIAEFSALHGADLIIGGHPHVVQPVKKVYAGNRDSVWTFFSLGNFISNQRDRYKNGGIMAEITLIKKNGKTYLGNLNFLPVYVHKQISPKTEFVLVPGYLDADADSLLSLSNADKLLKNQFLADTRNWLRNISETGFKPEN